MKLIFMGTPAFAVPSLCALAAAGHEVAAAVTQPDKPQGRGYTLKPPPVKVRAAELGIPVYQPETLKNEALLPLLDELRPDVIVVAAYGKILPEYVLRHPKYGCINVHASLLPKYRGAGPIQWAVINGEDETGVTVMQMEKGIDTGDMFLKRSVPIGEFETAGEVHDRLAVLGAELIAEALEKLPRGELKPEKQDDAFSTHAPMLTKEMALIDWRKPARDIINRIRGMNPWPVAYTTVEDKLLKIFMARPWGPLAGEPGLVERASDEGFVVCCGDGNAIILKTVQLECARTMDCSLFMRGHDLVGQILGK